MSWTDDIRCLYCDGKLALYRKITHGQFCSTAHRKAYWLEQEKLVVERLEQTHNALHAYRPPGAVAAILGRPEPQREPIPPDPAGRVPELLPLGPGKYPELVAADPIAYEMGPRPYVLFELEVQGLHDPAPGDSLPIFAATSIFPGTGFTPIASAATTENFEPPKVTRPGFPDFTVAPAYTEELPDAVDGQIPAFADPVPLSRPCSRESFVPGVQPTWIPMVLSAELPLATRWPQPELMSTLLFGLGIESIPLVQGPWIDHLDPVILNRDLAAPPLVPPSMLMLQMDSPVLSFAGGTRYPVAVSHPGALHSEPEQIAFLNALRISLPQRPAIPQAARVLVPSSSGLVSMALAKSAVQAIPIPQQPLLIPQPSRTAPSVPASKFEPLDSKPIADILIAPQAEAAPAPQEDTPKAAAPPPPTRPDGVTRPPARKTYPWTPAADFLRNAPRDLKMLVFAIPVLLGLALHPSLPKVKVSAPTSTAGIERNVENAVNTQLVTFRQSVLDRAAVALDEDFRSGLDEWVSRNDATAEWSFDATGFVQPGPLALYRPSLGLTDYQFQFLGMIDKKALSWVVRAADFQNYYVVKLVVLKGGPLPTIGVTRYAVINGKPEARADSIAPVDAREDMLYRVRLDVHGDTFVLVVQGQVVDSWSEPRLQHGGVGFFSARGESSRVRWVQVTHQYDMLGRLCAYLAPYNNSSGNGSFQP